MLDDDSYPETRAISAGLAEFSRTNKLSILSYRIFNTRIQRSETEDFLERPYMFNGCGAMIKKEVLTQVGYYNDKYFLYYNELDYSARCYNAGYNIKYLPTATVIHSQSLKSRGTKKEDPFRSEYRYYYYYLSYAIFLIQNFDTRYTLKYLAKYVLNRLLICLAYGYYKSFIGGTFFCFKNFSSLRKPGSILKPEIQKFYRNGNIALIDRLFFPALAYRDKINLRIYINNIFAFVLFRLMRLAFGKGGDVRSQKILVMNADKIGDLVISSTLMTNDRLLSKDYKLFFLVQKKYQDLFQDYTGPINLLFWDYDKYKHNLYYRIKHLKYLRHHQFDKLINLSSSRRIIFDELAILSGCKETFCFSDRWISVKKLFTAQMNRYYTKVLDYNSLNEYLRIVGMLEFIFEKQLTVKPSIYISNNTVQNIRSRLVHKYKNSLFTKSTITIAPLTDREIKNWGIENYRNLCGQLCNALDAYVILIGSKEQREQLNVIRTISPGRIFNVAGEFSIIESAAIIKMSSLFIGSDSGFTHVAKAIGREYIGIIGGGSYGIYFPYHVSSNEHLLYYELECFGCQWNCIMEKPYCHFNVNYSEVFELSYKLLN